MAEHTWKRDFALRPAVFFWKGPVERARLDEWIHNAVPGRALPADLVDFWTETGGGEIFETETLLSPLDDPGFGNDVATVGRDLQARGLPVRFLPFHRGYCLSAVDLLTGELVVLDDSFEIRARYASFDDWYVGTLRDEYASRYGL